MDCGLDKIDIATHWYYVPQAESQLRIVGRDLSLFSPSSGCRGGSREVVTPSAVGDLSGFGDVA
jgi:hypothetical protein